MLIRVLFQSYFFILVCWTACLRVVEPSDNFQIEITAYPDSVLLVLTFICLESVQTGWTDPHHDYYKTVMTTTWLNPRLLFIQMVGDVYENPGPAAKYPCHVCSGNVTSRGVSYQCNRCSEWVHSKCIRLLNAAHYRRNNGCTSDPSSASPTRISPHNPRYIYQTN